MPLVISQGLGEPARGVPPPRVDHPMDDPAWLALWRTLWLDLPLAWADTMARSLSWWLPPGSDRGTVRRDLPDRELLGSDLPDASWTSAEVVALGLGCGDVSGDILG